MRKENDRSAEIVKGLDKRVRKLLSTAKTLHEDFYRFRRILEKQYHQDALSLPRNLAVARKAAVKILTQYDDACTRAWATSSVLNNHSEQLCDFLNELTGAKYERQETYGKTQGTGYGAYIPVRTVFKGRNKESV